MICCVWSEKNCNLLWRQQFQNLDIIEWSHNICCILSQSVLSGEYKKDCILFWIYGWHISFSLIIMSELYNGFPLSFWKKPGFLVTHFLSCIQEIMSFKAICCVWSEKIATCIIIFVLSRISWKTFARVLKYYRSRFYQGNWGTIQKIIFCSDLWLIYFIFIGKRFKVKGKEKWRVII